MASPQAMPQLIATSSEFVKVMKKAMKIAPFPDAVLITGETGVGKERVARLIHEESKRKNTFIVVNCPALPKDLVESELFGHERGAFTNATASKPGLFEIAEGGTIFLDEVGELDSLIQAKLLRVLDGSECRRVGGHSQYYPNVRIIAATNRANLREVLREDLYFRLDTLRIEVPPLRKRPDDIGPLSNLFAAPDHAVGSDALNKLLGHLWPGNVRELRNTVRRACIDPENVTLSEKDITLSQYPATTYDNSLLTSVRVLEQKCLEAWLVKAKGNIREIAAGMGISRQAVHDKLKKYGLDHHDFQKPSSEFH